MNIDKNIVMDAFINVVMKRQTTPQNPQSNHQSSRRLNHQRRPGVRKKWTGPAMLFGLLMVASGVQATPQEFSDQEIRGVGSSITTGSVPGIYIATTNTERSLDGCGAQFFVGAANPLLNQSLAIALSALYTKSHVRIEVDGCQGDDAMRIKSIRVAR